MRKGDWAEQEEAVFRETRLRGTGWARQEAEGGQHARPSAWGSWGRCRASQPAGREGLDREQSPEHRVESQWPSLSTEPEVSPEDNQVPQEKKPKFPLKRRLSVSVWPHSLTAKSGRPPHPVPGQIREQLRTSFPGSVCRGPWGCMGDSWGCMSGSMGETAGVAQNTLEEVLLLEPPGSTPVGTVHWAYGNVF